jgi:acyl-CoA hydrolase
MELRSVAESRVEMVELVLPNDANPLGHLLGGKVMHLVDIAAAIAAHRHCRCPVVTASVDRINFLHPVRVGEIIILQASVNHAAHTSMDVGVRVLSEDLDTGDRLHTASAYATFVALAESGRPVAVPQLVLESDEDRRRFREAAVRRAVRLRERADRGERLRDEDVGSRPVNEADRGTSQTGERTRLGNEPGLVNVDMPAPGGRVTEGGRS